MELLSPAWRTIACDHRGTGATLIPVESITFDALVAELFRVMDAYRGERCVVTGESAGPAWRCGPCSNGQNASRG